MAPTAWMEARHASLCALAEANEDHMATFIRAHDAVFLDPSMVGDLRSPVSKQLARYLQKAALDATALDDIEHALRTGELVGFAACAASDAESDDGMIEIEWRDDTITAWAASLRSAARHAGSLVMTTDGECVGPLPIWSWVVDHLPRTLAAIRREIAADLPLTAQVAQPLAMDLAGTLQCQLDACENTPGRGGSKPLEGPVVDLLLAVHFWGSLPEAWLAADARARAMRVALAAVRAWYLGAESCASSEAHHGHGSGEGELNGDGDGALARIQALAFISSLLVEQDAEHAATEARHHAELGIGDEPAEPTEAYTLLQLAIAACSAAEQTPE